MEKKAKTKDNENKVFIYSNACERRRIDTKKISTYFSKNNYKIVNDPKDADHIIFVTCSFVESMIDNSLDTIKKFKKYDAELIVAGCMPEIAGERLKSVFDGKTINTKDMDKIDEIFNNNIIKFSEIDDKHFMQRNFNPFGISAEPINISKNIVRKVKLIGKIYKIIKENVLKKLFGNVHPFSILFDENYEHYIITISRGCIHNCSYCAIKKAVGPLKSKPIDQCIKEFKLGLNEGYKDFELAADDIGPYGVDINRTLPELLDEITKINGDYTIRFQNTHPAWIIKHINEFEEILKRKKIKYILLSIQSGNNRVLKLMRRSYTKETLIDAITKLKKADPDLRIGAELMVGFPSETWEEFRETLELFKKIPFNKGTIASCSLIDGTEAITMEPKISRREMHKRMRTTLKFLRKAGYFAWYSEHWKGIAFHKK